MKILTISFLILLSGCAVKKEWAPVGGSRADGVVRFAYSYGGFESPRVDSSQLAEVAQKRCMAWGYQSAEEFGPVLKTCNANNQYGCIAWVVSKDFQCVGQPDRSVIKE